MGKIPHLLVSIVFGSAFSLSLANTPDPFHAFCSVSRTHVAVALLSPFQRGGAQTHTTTLKCVLVACLLTLSHFRPPRVILSRREADGPAPSLCVVRHCPSTTLHSVAKVALSRLVHSTSLTSPSRRGGTGWRVSTYTLRTVTWHARMYKMGCALCKLPSTSW